LVPATSEVTILSLDPEGGGIEGSGGVFRGFNTCRI